MSETEEGTKESARQRALADLSDQALGDADLAALMATLTELIAKTLNVEFCKVLELLPGKNHLLLRAGFGWRAGSVGHVTEPAGTGSPAGYTLLCDQPVI